MKTPAATLSEWRLEIVFVVTLATSALLLFWVQPMFAKMVLPLLGGAPAVWNTAMVFFQACLLAGYAYAHISTSILDVRKQSLIHLAVLFAAVFVLPIAVSGGWTPPTDKTPVFWLIGLLTVSIGLPFFALSASAPLLQKWFSHTTHADAHNPYFLYAASNAGSIVALVAYPVLLEPFLGVHRQSWLWSAVYGLLILLVVVCAFLLRREYDAGRAAQLARQVTFENRAVSWKLYLRWVVLAFVPSSLLLGVTTHVTTDIASAPLLWVIPLALYLLSFVLVFARKPLVRHLWVVKAQTYVVMVLVVALHFNILSLSFTVFLHLLAFFITATVCHGELARIRPEAGHLTSFYLWMSVGGVLGGVFNALLAPVVFVTVAEYPIAVALACALRPTLNEGVSGRRSLDFVLPVLLAAAVLVFLLVPAEMLLPIVDQRWKVAILAALVAIIIFGFSTRPVRFALGIGVLLFAGSVLFDMRSTVHAERSFFGVHRVKFDAAAEVRYLRHGSTLHGAQSTDPTFWREPLAYYTPGSPVGQLFAELRDVEKDMSVGVIGLGTGAMACYKRDSDKWRFFEIDPAVVRIARDQRLFNYLAECASNTPIVLGDARLSLEDEADGSFDLLVLDAFSSDSIPVNLITAEAFELYFRKLAKDGLLFVHISNRFLKLEPVLANLAVAKGWPARIQVYAQGSGQPTNWLTGQSSQGTESYRMSSQWVLIAADEAELTKVANNPNWRRLEPDVSVGVWTDDYSNIVRVMRWGRPASY